MPRQYFTFVSAVHLFLIQNDQILLLRRFNTGFEDGKYSVPAGHIDGGEKVTNAMIREAKEEIGLALVEDQLRVVHVMHRNSKEERIDFFFEAKNWAGTPTNAEPDRCDDLRWFPINQLPENIIPYVKSGIENYLHSLPFTEFGF